MVSNGLALVLGATGGVGGAMASALRRHGWTVRGMARDADAAAERHPDFEWVSGDAMNRDDVMAAARHAAVIVHAVNPPHYRNWDRVVLPMIDNTIAAARLTGARIVLPGTIYNFDPAKTPLISATTPQNPHSRKGAIRVALESRLKDAAPEVRTLILRAGDFFGPGARSNWFSQAMVAPGKPVSRVVKMTRGPGHSWAYLPDLAEAAATLIDLDARLAPFESVQFEGYYDASGFGLIDAIGNAARTPIKTVGFPWWLMHVLSPFGGFPGEASELAQYWRHPVKLDNKRLVEIIGEEPRTPLDIAMRTTLVGLGCLADNPAQIAQSRHTATQTIAS